MNPSNVLTVVETLLRPNTIVILYPDPFNGAREDFNEFQPKLDAAIPMILQGLPIKYLDLRQLLNGSRWSGQFFNGPRFPKMLHAIIHLFECFFAFCIFLVALIGAGWLLLEHVDSGTYRGGNDPDFGGNAAFEKPDGSAEAKDDSNPSSIK